MKLLKKKWNISCPSPPSGDNRSAPENRGSHIRNHWRRRIQHQIHLFLNYWHSLKLVLAQCHEYLGIWRSLNVIQWFTNDCFMRGPYICLCFWSKILWVLHIHFSLRTNFLLKFGIRGKWRGFDSAELASCRGVNLYRTTLKIWLRRRVERSLRRCRCRKEGARWRIRLHPQNCVNTFEFKAGKKIVQLQRSNLK